MVKRSGKLTFVTSPLPKDALCFASCKREPVRCDLSSKSRHSQVFGATFPLFPFISLLFSRSTTLRSPTNAAVSPGLPDALVLTSAASIERSLFRFCFLLSRLCSADRLCQPPTFLVDDR